MSYFEREVELASSVGRLPAEDTLTLTSMNEQIKKRIQMILIRTKGMLRMNNMLHK